MSTGVSGDEPAVGADVPRQMGPANPETLRIGCIAIVLKDGQDRRAEILSIKVTRSGRQFYCNFDNFNKRLDEWVPASRIRFDKDVEWPNPDKDLNKSKDLKTKKTAPPAKKTLPGKKTQKRPPKSELSVSVISDVTGGHPWTEFVESQQSGPSLPDGQSPAQPSPSTGQPETPSATTGVADISIDDGDTETNDATAAATPQNQNEDLLGFSRGAEIEKLRTSGSMTQNPAEISRIRNISKVQFGKFDLFPWYFSPYPEEFGAEDVMFICEFCLSYYCDQVSFRRHRQKCGLHHPPGNEIYRDEHGISFFEIDGRRQRTWCRNLCLLSKMFLDHKTLYYDVDPFLFYVMTIKTENGCHLVGYFSKEKESADGYNVACILTLPQYQRQGYGRLLIQFSYELSKIEGKLGSPEKPLSDLGLLSYRQYWSENILDLLLTFYGKGEKVTIEAVSHMLAMTTQDVEHTLQALKMQVYHRGDHKIVIPENLIEQREKQKLKRRRLIDPEKIQWKPPTFHAAARTWGW